MLNTQYDVCGFSSKLNVIFDDLTHHESNKQDKILLLL